MVRHLVAFGAMCVLSLAAVRPVAAQADIILRTSNFSNVHGNWSVGSASSAADGQYMGSSDYGWGTTSAPLAQPNDYFEARFDAPAGTAYHVWVRMRASGNSKWNDSVWLQYSDAVDSGGGAAYRIGTTSALDVNLERCSGCGVSAWGWQDGAYWLSQATTIRFQNTGTHTLRVQIREDGAQIDQIVLSSASYLYSSPGQMTNDSVIVPTSGGTAAASSAAGPYLGSPVSLPGKVEAENFDNGADGVSYHDATGGNAGGAYRSTNMDIEASSEGGHNLGWLQAGEWTNYAVTTGSAGSYTVKLRVASQSGGGSLHVGFNGPSNVWQSVSIPSTGGWQNWTTVTLPVTLGGGSQTMTIAVDSGGFNLNYIEVASGTTGTTSSTPPPSTASGSGSLTVVTWNVQVNDSSAGRAQRMMDEVTSMTPTPQVVVIQEAHRSVYSSYINELQARTGRTWRGVMQTHCPPGAFNGSSCSGSEDEGVAIFTSLSVVDSSTTFLPGADQYHSARGAARLAVNFNGVVVQVFGVHLPVTASARSSAMGHIKWWASNYSAPQLAGGDFNADPDQIDPGMAPNFVNSWGMVGSGAGYTAFTPSPTMKLDHWLQDPGGRARPEWSVVVTRMGTLSDHLPVINSYAIR